MRTIRAVDQAKPRAIDLFCGKGGWSHGLLASGWDVDGYDIADMGGYPGRLHLRDVRTIDGAEFADAGLIVASPPCQEYSYMAMPWRRGKQIAAALRGNGEFPEEYTGSRTIAELNALFDSCFRIQREASAARGGHVPMVVENVKGAEPWVGRARCHFGSFYLWGDVPALMPSARAIKVAGFRFDGSGRSFQTACVEGMKQNRDGTNHPSGSWFAVADSKQRGGRKGFGNSWFGTDRADPRDVRQSSPGVYGIKQGGEWWHDPASITPRTSSRSAARKEASARIAMIPFTLARWIGECYYPADMLSVRTAKALCLEVLA